MAYLPQMSTSHEQVLISLKGLAIVFSIVTLTRSLHARKESKKLYIVTHRAHPLPNFKKTTGLEVDT